MTEIQESVRYLSSEAAVKSLQADPYWPKWNSPWWHMLLLHEMGETGQIPQIIVEKMLEALDNYPLKVFSSESETLAQGFDYNRHVPCHCALGNIYQVLSAWGVDVDLKLPWIRQWFLKYQMADGGLNCDSGAYFVKDECPSSMVGTIAVFEAVLLYTKRPWTTEEMTFLNRGAKFLIGRKLMLGSQTKYNAEERDDEADWLKLCFPRFYFYDVLRGLNALVQWGEKTNQHVPPEAIAGVVSHLKKRFPDGIMRNERTCYVDTGTILQKTDGEWIRKQPATFFPLLEKVSAIGEPSPHLIFS